jgi:FtsP/CotA-like multicopper oxidase with cupredoxin domain
LAHTRGRAGKAQDLGARTHLNTTTITFTKPGTSDDVCLSRSGRLRRSRPVIRPGAAQRSPLRRLARAGLVAACAGALLPAAASARTVHYWVAAVPRPWNIAPNGKDAINHTPVDTLKSHISTVVYQRFTRQWAHRLSNDSAGLAGPLIRAQVGDTIKVHFQNLDLDNPHSMHFHGVRYAPSSDGSYVPGFSGRGADVKPGDSFTYTLHAARGSVGVWPYHDHSPSMMESIDGGMSGVLSIRPRGERLPDRENVVVLESVNGFMTIDGRAFVGNTPVFHSRVGDLVQWDVMGIGDDFHTFHVHGHRWFSHGTPIDTQTVGPAESFRIRWREDAPGTWLYHCHVESHMMSGMIGIYRVAKARRS